VATMRDHSPLDQEQQDWALEHEVRRQE
jgi:hypothetical protein